jgi:hypothetical protein
LGAAFFAVANVGAAKRFKALRLNLNTLNAGKPHPSTAECGHGMRFKQNRHV